MKNSLFAATNWLLCNPRRALAVVFVVAVVLTLAFSVVPNGVTFAEAITSGS